MGRPAARVTDKTICPMVTGTVPHVGGPIVPPCQVNVLVGGLPQARVGDKSICAAGGPSAIITGSPTVLVGGRPAARIGDMHAHGGTIVTGCPTVLIGEAGGVGPVGASISVAKPCFKAAAEAGSAFVKS